MAIELLCLQRLIYGPEYFLLCWPHNDISYNKHMRVASWKLPFMQNEKNTFMVERVKSYIIFIKINIYTEFNVYYSFVEICLNSF